MAAPEREYGDQNTLDRRSASDKWGRPCEIRIGGGDRGEQEGGADERLTLCRSGCVIHPDESMIPAQELSSGCRGFTHRRCAARRLTTPEGRPLRTHSA